MRSGRKGWDPVDRLLALAGVIRLGFSNWKEVIEGVWCRVRLILPAVSGNLLSKYSLSYLYLG